MNNETKFLNNYGFGDLAAINYAEELFAEYEYLNSDEYIDDLPF